MITRKSIAICCMFAFFTAIVPSISIAESGSFSTWLKSMTHKLKLSSSSSSSGKDSKTAVAGIKGTEGEVSEDIYWKSVKIDPAERSAFDEAIKLAEEGKKEMALKKLEDFISKYPKSPLTKDANDGIALLKGDAKPNEKK